MKTYELKSERVARLREEALAKEPGVCVERARYLTKAYKENEEKSKYTLDLLQLNTFGNNLPEARLKALTEFRSSVNKNMQQTKRDIQEIAMQLLSKENLAFISFLRFKYKNLLQGATA